ncbi:MAG: DUF5723 family protein [Candidatus Cryptobacteroides sp.]
MRKYHIILLCLLMMPLTLGAQTLRGSYFLDNSLARTKLNPAFSPRANYFSIPVLGNTGVGIYSNVGVANFLFPMDGQLYTYLNQNVSADQFLKGLPTYPSFDLSFDTDLINFGFYTSPEAFWSFESGVTVDGTIGIPRDFLEFTKRGMSAGEATTYSLKGFNVFANASIYAAVGHSRDLSEYVEGLRVGAKLKFYIPVAYVGLDLENSTMTFSGDKWMVNTDATGTIASSFLRLTPPAKAGEAPGFDINTSKIGPAGFGIGVDLGAEYRLSIGSVVDGLTFSASVLDLGGYFFGKDKVQNLASKGSAAFEGFNDITFDENTKFDELLEGVKNDFLALADFEEVAGGSFSLGTRTTFNLGVEYPFLNDKMSVGLLYTLKSKYNRNLFNELTVSYNLNPCKWFNFGLNWSFLNSYKTLGWIIEFTPKAGVDFFIGSDYTFFEVMPKIPLPIDKVWTNARFGLSFMLGSKHRD